MSTGGGAGGASGGGGAYEVGSVQLFRGRRQV